MVVESAAIISAYLAGDFDPSDDDKETPDEKPSVWSLLRQHDKQAGAACRTIDQGASRDVAAQMRSNGAAHEDETMRVEREPAVQKGKDSAARKGIDVDVQQISDAQSLVDKELGKGKKPIAWLNPAAAKAEVTSTATAPSSLTVETAQSQRTESAPWSKQSSTEPVERPMPSRQVSKEPEVEPEVDEPPPPGPGSLLALLLKPLEDEEYLEEYMRMRRSRSRSASSSSTPRPKKMPRRRAAQVQPEPPPPAEDEQEFGPNQPSTPPPLDDSVEAGASRRDWLGVYERDEEVGEESEEQYEEDQQQEEQEEEQQQEEEEEEQQQQHQPAETDVDARPTSPLVVRPVPKPRARASRQASTWTRWVASDSDQPWWQAKEAASLEPSPPLDDHERTAMQVLARHAARLGVACVGLEHAVHRAAAQAEARSSSTSCWNFMFNDAGWEAYKWEKSRFRKIYTDFGRTHQGDEQAVQQLPAKSQDGLHLCPVPPTGAWYASKEKWDADGMLQLPVPEVRFAHDKQSEHFGRASSKEGKPAEERESILQLAVELVARLTKPEAVPAFSVCKHEGLWYCRSGNRRLAALRLANRFAPERFAWVKVKVVPVDHSFLHDTGNRQRKLTTSRNSPHCYGQWLNVLETGEAIGRGAYRTEYGADLLSLLFPTSGSSTASVVA